MDTPMVSKPKTSPKDVFTYLLAIIALYFSAGNFMALMFQYINLWFPDVVVDSYYALQSVLGIIRWSVSSLLIVFPVYVLATMHINKTLVKEPARRELWIRKWLVYFTVFAAALVIIGSLVVLVNSFLGGELTMRFLLKLVTVLFVAVAIFAYYLWDIRSESHVKPMSIVALKYAVILAVLGAIVGAFFIVGSPQTARLQEQDARRVSDLQNLQYHIVDYWQNKEGLPTSLSVLEDDLRGVIAPTDPVTNEAYIYRATGALSFELCATFAQPSVSFGTMSEVAEPRIALKGESTWTHDAGETCFERTIDPDFYRPLDAKPW